MPSLLLARRVLPPALLAVMAAFLILSSLHKPLAYDEFDNLAYGYRFLDRGPGAPMRGQRMPVLALNALGCTGEGCRQETVNASEAALLKARMPTILLTLLLGVLVHRWGREVLGEAGALAALWLYVFNPSFLAHGNKVTSDVPAALFTAAALYFFWKLCRRPQAVSLVLCAIATAGALLSKYTSLLLLPVFALLLALRWFELAREARHDRAGWLKTVAAAAGFLLLVLFLVNAAYLFKGTFRPWRDYAWESQAFRSRELGSLPIPLPRVFVQGLDYSSYLQEHVEVGRGLNYVLGRLSTHGVWYAFPLMILLKTPLAFFGLLGLAIAARNAEPRPDRWTWLVWLVPFAAVVACFSLLATAQLGIRYLLPGLPTVVLCAAHGAAFATTRARRALVGALLAWYAVSTLSYHPHYIAYFNELIGRRVNAYRYLADSNLDWEDHSYFIARFQARHPEMAIAVEPPAPRTGYVLVGANRLVGIYEPERYAWLRENFEPIRHVAYSHLLFYVPEKSP
jgi:Dolichyl-phosphate-mannose-protein mannosyltransferase